MVEDYKVYKEKLSKEEYFEKWNDNQLTSLTNDMKEEIYQKYLVKCEVFQRDGFVCQSAECKNPDAKLTMHHVKFQKNGGEHKAKNCVTLCHTCHKGFHAGKYPLTLKDTDNLPSHMKGHTFKLDKTLEINWKVIKKEMKQLRKNVHEESGYKISWEHLAYLMRWLEIVWDENLDD